MPKHVHALTMQETEDGEDADSIMTRLVTHRWYLGFTHDKWHYVMPDGEKISFKNRLHPSAWEVWSLLERGFLIQRTDLFAYRDIGEVYGVSDSGRIVFISGRLGVKLSQARAMGHAI